MKTLFTFALATSARTLRLLPEETLVPFVNAPLSLLVAALTSVNEISLPDGGGGGGGGGLPLPADIFTVAEAVAPSLSVTVTAGLPPKGDGSISGGWRFETGFRLVGKLP